MYYCDVWHPCVFILMHQSDNRILTGPSDFFIFFIIEYLLIILFVIILFGKLLEMLTQAVTMSHNSNWSRTN